jgi:hypothetical protein
MRSTDLGRHVPSAHRVREFVSRDAFICHVTMSLYSRTLAVFLHTTSGALAALTSVLLVGFFLSSDWAGSLATGSPEQMLTAVNDFKLQAALHVPVNAQSFATYNQTAVNQCPPTVSTACPASVSGMLWGAHS